MLLKIAGLFVLAVTTRIEHAGNQVQWIYQDGPDKGYLCALMEKDGARFDVYVPSASPAVTSTSAGGASSMGLVPWQQFASEEDAKNAISAHCVVK